MARTFASASSEYLGFTPRTKQAWTLGFTVAALLRRNATGVYHTMLYHGVSGGFTNGDPDFGITNSDDLYVSIGGTNRTYATTITAATQLLAVTKAAGTATPVAHISVAPYTTWTHANMSGTLGDPATTATSIEEVGRWNGTSGDYFAGDMEWVGLWGYNMSNNEVESLPFIAPDRLANLFPVTQRFWWFNQGAVTDTVRCLANSLADQTARTGTTITANNGQFPRFGATPPPDLIVGAVL